MLVWLDILSPTSSLFELSDSVYNFTLFLWPLQVAAWQNHLNMRLNELLLQVTDALVILMRAGWSEWRELCSCAAWTVVVSSSPSKPHSWRLLSDSLCLCWEDRKSAGATHDLLFMICCERYVIEEGIFVTRTSNEKIVEKNTNADRSLWGTFSLHFTKNATSTDEWGDMGVCLPCKIYCDWIWQPVYLSICCVVTF